MMSKLAVIKTGGKQYLVKENNEIIVDRLEEEKGKKVDLVTLAVFDTEKEDLEIGTPTLTKNVQAEILEHLKGDKIRVAKFKAKVRYRRVRGFRSRLTKLKISKID